MLLAVAAVAHCLFCHKLILVTFHLDDGTKVEISSFSFPDIKVSFIPTALLWINLAVAREEYLKTSPVLDLHSMSLLKIKKIIWRESHST